MIIYHTVYSEAGTFFNSAFKLKHLLLCQCINQELLLHHFNSFLNSGAHTDKEHNLKKVFDFESYPPVNPRQPSVKTTETGVDPCLRHPKF